MIHKIFDNGITTKKEKEDKKLLLQGGLLSLKRGILAERNPHVFLQLPFAINIASLAKSIRLVNKNRCFNGK